MPETPAETSPSRATISAMAKGTLLRIDYDWSFQGDPQEGSLRIGYEPDANSVMVAWIDTMHNGDKIMLCTGTLEEGNNVDVRGEYEALPGPNWGWRTRLETDGQDAWRLAMFNITPDGQEVPAVEVHYTRLPG